MSGLNRMSIDSDFDENKGLWIAQLNESLELMSNKIRLLEKEQGLIKEADKIVRPPSLREFPLAASGINKNAIGAVGDIIIAARSTTPAGTLPCDGATITNSSYPALASLLSGTVYDIGGGQSTVPDLRGRVPMGIGTGASLTARTLGDSVGTETETAPLPVHSHSHSHTVNSHTHTGPSHTHDMGNHTHGITHFTSGGGAGAEPLTTASPNSGTAQTSGPPNVNVTGAGGTGNTGSSAPGTDTDATSAGAGGSHNNVQPSEALGFFIRYLVDGGETQTAVISWGRVLGTWSLNTTGTIPAAAAANDSELVGDAKEPEGVVKLTSTGGGNSGANVSLTLTGLARIPYNFRQFRADAFKINTRVSATGVNTSTSISVRLKVNDPTVDNTSTFLASTYLRTVSESSNTIDDGEYVEAGLDAGELGPTWKPGYLFRFELIFEVPQTFTNLELQVGKLEMNWR